jgi:hypothetical protein
MGGGQAQSYSPANPTTRDLRDVFVGFEVSSDATHTTVKLELGTGDNSVLHNEVIFNFPDFNSLYSNGYTEVRFSFGDEPAGSQGIVIHPNDRISHVYPLNMGNSPTSWALNLFVKPNHIFYNWGNTVLTINPSNPVSGGIFTPPNLVKHITGPYAVNVPVSGAFPDPSSTVSNYFNTNGVGSADVYVQYSPAHNGKMLKPLIFVDGIDFDETTYTWDGVTVRHGSTGWDIFTLGNDGSDPNSFDPDLR